MRQAQICSFFILLLVFCGSTCSHDIADCDSSSTNSQTMWPWVMNGSFVTPSFVIARVCLLIPWLRHTYEPLVSYDQNKKVMYVKLKKAICGTLHAKLLFWQNLSSTLEDWGFVINPYDSCVANKQIDSSQCTILWYVDHLKMSHGVPSVVSGVITQLEKEFGKEGPLIVTGGNLHEYQTYTRRVNR